MGLLRTKAQWSIPGAGTAYSVFHFGTSDVDEPDQTNADQAVAKTRKFFDDLKVALPNQVTVQALGEAEQLNEATGTLLHVWSVATPAIVQGTAAAATGWSAPTGAVASWTTQGIRNGRRIRGRTFIVPLTTGAYDTNGTLRPGEHAVINAAAQNIWDIDDTVQFSVYARPTVGVGGDGIAYPVQSHRVPDMCAILRSRRS